MDMDIAVVGGGIIGSTAAQSLSRAFPGRVAHVAPAAPRDERTTALLNEAVDTLRELGVWDVVEPGAAKLRVMRLLDGSKRLIRARPLEFRASEVGLQQFGWNVANEALVRAFGGLEGSARHETSVRSMRRKGNVWELATDDGRTVDVRAVVAADGRNSIIREAAGIGARRWSYDQVALVTTFSHELPHGDQSVEFHTETGPCTQVPLPATAAAPHRSSLVFVVHPSQMGDLLALDRSAVSDVVGEKLHHLFGAVELERDLASYPLSGLTAEAFGRDGVFLVGEAAHVFPPIGAQGANLGFRDVRDCAECLRQGPSAVEASARYSTRRLADIGTRTAAVDTLNRSLLTDFLPVQLGRAFAFEVLARSPAARRNLMRAGLR